MNREVKKIALSALIDLNNLVSGTKIRIEYAIDELDGTTERAIRVSVYENGVHQATVVRSDANRLVRGEAPTYVPDTISQ